MFCQDGGTHKIENLIKRANPTREQEWCGEWYDCPTCLFSILVPSQALTESLKQQEESNKFPVGQKVVLARIKHEGLRGQQGVVKRVYKTKREIRIKLQDGSSYDAYPENLDPVKD